MRNAIYAWHGYKFTDKELNDFFSKQLWYFLKRTRRSG
ncbi:MAG TPA: YARHG domain-containing protein [Firmicutes bacterium]|nr:YARHG domain-containing protein [Bacillota bacterium]